MDNIKEIKRKIKQYESNMVISGMGVIVFGLWSIIKLLISVIYGSQESRNEILGLMEGEDALYVNIIMALIIVILSIIIILIHGYIGIKSIRYGRGTKRNIFFLFIAFVLAVLTITGIPNYFKSADTGAYDFSKLEDTVVASILVDLAFCYILFDIVYSAIRLAYFNKKMKEQEA